MSVKLGDIVEVNGQQRIVTAVFADSFQSSPYENNKVEIETIKVEPVKPAKAEKVVEEKPIKGRGKNKK